MIAAPACRHWKRRCACALLFAAFALATTLGAAPHFIRESELIDRVVELMDRRLALMPEVAAIKFQQRKPVIDAAREREVLAQSVAEAQTLHLDAEAARVFFATQIAMARGMQEHLLVRWRAGAAQPPPARDLVKELRPELDAVGRELLPAVFLASPTLVDLAAPALQEQLARLQRHAGVTGDQLAELARALTRLRITSPPTWDSLRRVGVLRVGTTGDYAPFSDDRGSELRGLDIELAEALARSWGVRILFVRTSWPALMDDLARQRFDLAASGISVTDERRQRADFSEPYYFDGKTPIARREDAARFASLEQIDQPGVRVIVNPGGTNERFARERLQRATIVVHPDNRTIFEEITAGRADVMITDGVEVRLQERRHPALQGTRAEPFTRIGKAFLLSRSSELTARLDLWLKPQRERGTIAEQLARALEAK